MHSKGSITIYTDVTFYNIFKCIVVENAVNVKITTLRHSGRSYRGSEHGQQGEALHLIGTRKSFIFIILKGKARSLVT